MILDMKPAGIITSAFAAFLLLIPSVASAFDWKPQSNEELKGDMMEYARQFADSCKGSKAERIVRKLLKKQSKAKEPYSWIADTHKAVSDLKKEYGPEIVIAGTDNKRADIRRYTLQLLDYPLHVDDRGAATPKELKDVYEAANRHISQGHASPHCSGCTGRSRNRGPSRCSRYTIWVSVSAHRNIPY